MKKKIGLIVLVIGLAIVFIGFTQYEYYPANEWKPAVILKPSGEPVSLPIKDKPIVVMTGWGTPEGFSKAYDDYLFWRTSGGERVTGPDQVCTQWHAGTFPFQVEISRLPFAIGRKVKGLERLWDSVGTYRISEDGQSYIPVVANKLGDFPYVGGGAEILYKEDLDGVEIFPMKDYVSFSSRDTGGLPLIRYTPDPRNGIDHLEGFFLIKKANGVNDYYEIDKAYKARIAGMMGWDPEELAHFPEDEKVEVLRDPFIRDYIGKHFDNKIKVKEGYYSSVPGQTDHLKDTMPRMARNGYRNVVLAKPITDHNKYANNFWDLHLSLQSLCRAGFNVNDFDINQVRMYGRTPEYNHIMHKNLQRHLNHIDPGNEVAVIYTTFGLPWPGANPVGPMSNAHPFIQEVFHENAYQNFLSFKRYIEQNEKEHKITFNRTGGIGSADARTNNLFAYALFNSNQLGHKEDPLAYKDLRETIEDAILNQQKKEVIIQLSHWGYDYWILIINMREALNIPLNTIEEIRQGEYRMTWCEKHHGPGDFEQKHAINHQCPEGFTRLQLMESFQDFSDDLAVNYVNRIRGGIERFGIFPDLDIQILGEGEVTELEGGSVEINQGPLSGTSIDIPADPQPGIPENYTWKNRWTPSNDGNSAVRAINEYSDLDDYLDSAKDDFTAVIGTQGKRTPDEPMPKHTNAVSPMVFFGPHRTIFNAPATITLPYDATKVNNLERVKPYVFNELTQAFEALPRVLKDAESVLDTNNNTLSFQVQVLGQFVLVEER